MRKRIEFVVRSEVPPKKDGATSMWGKGTEISRLIALRRAASDAMRGQPPFRSQIHLVLEIHCPSVDLGRVGDLDNFITGVCDGLMPADSRIKPHPRWSHEDLSLRPDVCIAIADDSEVVSVHATKVPEDTGATWYKVTHLRASDSLTDGRDTVQEAWIPGGSSPPHPEGGWHRMRIAFPVRVWEEDGVFNVRGLPPLENVLTYGVTLEDGLTNAREALTGVLGAMLDHGQPIPDPVPGADGREVYYIEPSPKVAVPILLRKAREAAGLTQGEVAAKLGVTYQAVQKWERSGANPTVDTVDRVLRALGRRLELEPAPIDTCPVETFSSN